MTTKRIFALLDSRWDSGGVGPWDHGSSTIAWLKREGLAMRDGAKYVLTDKGRAAAWAAARAAARSQCARRARELLLPDTAPAAAALRRRVAAHIEEHPELHDQSTWGDGSANPACGTPCCVAGWACHLGGGSYGLPVEMAATALLYLDGAPLPPFDGHAQRADILAALRAEATDATL